MLSVISFFFWYWKSYIEKKIIIIFLPEQNRYSNDKSLKNYWFIIRFATSCHVVHSNTSVVTGRFHDNTDVLGQFRWAVDMSVIEEEVLWDLRTGTPVGRGKERREQGFK